ncbi:ABC transporter ATP-binding protein [Erysipelothrix aquatica]|uniref:ABC transporter ATP-binding protein n=1 Tax=Erysipelothrix aquatica TaxID=2683714 RepID=UPI001358485C|nr:ABC transporter ATP-binding protein [Erysipelothrix aquatica]
MKIVEMNNVRKEYTDGEYTLTAVNNIDFHIEEGEIVAIIGPSGCGKTTLVNILGLILEPTRGEIVIDGKNIVEYREKDKAKARNEFFGYLTQDFSLVENDSVFDNIRIPLIYSSQRKTKREQRELILKYLNQLGLESIVDKKVKNLSGGQRQRVALIRAIVNEPRVIIADEPTGSLDSVTSKEIFDLLKGLVSEGISVLMVTHNLELASQCNRIVNMLDGQIID